ncbi:MAG: OmpH family outer membrane protein [Verrucomicrobia bacterium]|nr:OmpH family outer membrane protein [Verrucomicrobiota bacterium]
MKRRFISTLLTATCLSTAAFSAEAAPNFGIVNFGTCVSDSKLGKQEQASFESLKKQMATLLEDTEKQLNDLAAKFNDPEYLDGLSPEAEEDLKNKFRTLNEEMSRYQNQYYQVMNQANMRIIQTLSTSINSASEKVAKDKKLNMVVNKDACFYYTPGLDVTNLVIAEMDKNFATDSKKQTGAAETPAVEQKTEAKK